MPPRNPAETGLITVPIGPFGLFGERVMTPQQYAKYQKRKEAVKARKVKQRKAKAKKTAKRVITGKKPAKKKRWIIPGILYY